MALKPSILFYLGHDGNFTIYDPEKDEFVIVELERTIVDGEGAYSNGKHYAVMKNIDQDNLDLIFNRGITAAGYKDRTFDYYGSPITEVTVNRYTDSSGKLVKQLHDPKDMAKTRSKVTVSNVYNNPPRHMFRVTPKDIPDHHGCHAFGAYGQSNMDKAWVISYDGGGDDTCFRVTKINSVDDYTFKDEVFDLNGMYNMIAGNYMKRIIATTYSPLDIAGKVMGMAGFAKGKVSQEILDILPVITQTDKEEKFQQYQKELDLGHLKLSADAVKGIKPRFMMQYIEGTGLDFLQERVNRKVARSSEITEEDMENEHLMANTIQVYLEDFMINFIKSNLKEIKKYNNNVILTGGTALNVIANQRLRKEFPQLNFYVPSNPHDGGLSFGALWYLMSKKGIIKRNDYNVTYNGTKILDPNRLEQVKKRYSKHWSEVSMEDVANVLKDGKILGFVNGTSEVGPRALGNRSILADASYPNIKDIINAKVKKREPYRPFAPVCLLEDAPTYFDSPTFENMEAMQYVVDVKPEYRDKLPAITHIDGTARLQVVEEKNNKVFYDLLKTHGGVLLNTSFNLAGKPILNTYKDAINMWRNTEMDGLVIIDDEGKINLFL